MHAGTEASQPSYRAKAQLGPRGGQPSRSVELLVIQGEQRAVCRFDKGSADESIFLESAQVAVNASDQTISIEVATGAEAWKFSSLSDEAMSKLPQELSSLGAIRDDFESQYRLLEICSMSGSMSKGKDKANQAKEGFSFIGRAAPLHGPRTQLVIRVYPRSDADTANMLRTLRTLRHPNIVSLGQVFQRPNFKDQVVACFGALNGGTVFDFVRRNESSFEELQALKIFEQLCSALEHTHKHGFAHHLVNPSAVVFVCPGQDDVCLTDFSHATRIEEDSRGKDKFAGIPGYFGPEVLRNMPHSEKSDCFAAGAVLYFLLMGQELFASADIQKSLKRNARCSLRFDAAPVLTRCEELLRCLLDVDPAARFCMTKALEIVRKLYQIESKVMRPERQHVPADSLKNETNVPYEIRVMRKPDNSFSRHFRQLVGFQRDVSPASSRDRSLSSDRNGEALGVTSESSSYLTWESIAGLTNSTLTPIQPPPRAPCDSPRMQPLVKAAKEMSPGQPLSGGYASPKASNTEAARRKASAFDKFMQQNNSA